MIALVVLADGADVLLFRTTDAIAVVPAGALGRDAGRQRRRRSPTASFLSWRGQVTLEPPPPSRARSHLGVGVGPQRRSGSTRSSARVTASSGELHLPPARVSRRRCGRRRWIAAPMSRDRGHDRAVHDRPHRVLAEPADRVRGRRLRRRRPPAGRAHRRRRRRAQDRRPGRDDVPQAVHRRRHPQLLLEGQARPRNGPRVRTDHMGSHGIKDQVAIVGMGCTPLRRALGQGHRRPADRRGRTRRSRRRRRRPRTTSTRYWLGTAMSGMSGMALARPLQLHEQAGHAGSRTSAPPAPEALRQRRLRRGERRLRHRRWRSASRR